MGSASSKAAARKLPKEKPNLRVPPSATAEPARSQPEKPLAFESKNEVIESDAKDPHFMAKLSQLGPVRVDTHMHTIRAASDRDVRNMYHSRVQAEAEAASGQSTQNRLLASSLAELLEGRKTVTDRTGLETLAKRYHMDVAKLEQLGRVVNTPSIDENTVVRATDKHGEESVTMMCHKMNQAQWIDPVLSRA